MGADLLDVVLLLIEGVGEARVRRGVPRSDARQVRPGAGAVAAAGNPVSETEGRAGSKGANPLPA